MAPVFIPNWIYGVLESTSQGNVFENTFSFRKTSAGSPTGPELLALATNWWSQVGNSIKNATSNGVTYTKITLRDMSSAAGEEAVYNLPLGQSGSIASEPVPYNATSVMSWRSSHVGRRGRGRWYHPGIPENEVTGNLISSTLQSLLSGLAATIIGYSSGVATTVEPAIASRVGVILYDIASAVVDTFVDSQRRRLQGRGR